MWLIAHCCQEGRELVLGLEAAETAIPAHHHLPGAMVNTSPLSPLLCTPLPQSPLKGLPFGHVGSPSCTTCTIFPSQCLSITGGR